jgi:chemotaxis protein MotC
MNLVRASILTVWLLTGDISFAGPASVDVSGLLHTLHKVQDEIARGDLSALSIQTELTDRLKEGLESPLGDKSNKIEWATVAIGYSLDGANPQVARRLLARIDPTNPLHELAQAVSEYSTGNMKEAARLFDRVDLDRLDPRLAPYVALATGTANLKIDENKTLANFERAVLLGPGTLVEEVALRRLVMIGASKRDAALFQRAVNLYLRRYYSSPFARELFALLIQNASSLLDEQKTRDITALIVAQFPQSYTPVLLSLAETNAEAGKLDIVKFILDTYFAKSIEVGDVASQRIKLYQIISAPASEYNQNTLDAAKGIDPTALSTTEKILLAKAKAEIEGVLKPLTAIVDDRSQAANAFYQPKAEAIPVDTKEGAPPIPIPPTALGQSQPDKALVGAEVKTKTDPLPPASSVQATSGNAVPNPKVELDAATLPKSPPNDPVFGEIDAVSEQTKIKLQAVDDLLKDVKP